VAAISKDLLYEIHEGDCLAILPTLPAASVQCCVTSPPYFGLRDYGQCGQLGLEPTPDEYVSKLVAVFREVRRVLRDDGTVWLNLGDSYAGSGKGPAGNLGKTHNERHMEHTQSSGLVPKGLKPKDLIGIPWRVAFALQADGWYLRQDVIWHKPNPMPESVKDRCTKAHEYLFLLTKSAKYYYDYRAMKEKSSTGGSVGMCNKANSKRAETGLESDKDYVPNGTRNRRSAWTIATQPYGGAHFATFPPKLIEPCILAGSREGDTVIDMFAGTGTVGVMCLQHRRRFIGVELSPEYVLQAHERIAKES